jgi:putative aminopeptidase FrvX
MIILKEVLAIQTYSGEEWRMFAYIVRQCKRLGAHIRQDAVGNLYVTKGKSNTYPCVVAHMDSVHKIGEDLTVISNGKMLTGFNFRTMKQTGIGGDDKVGIYIALRCLETFSAIKLSFFVNEEHGCIGSSQADMTFFDDCRFVLQADRRGNSDFVTNASGVDLSSKKFKKAVNPLLGVHGYKGSDGMMTDVMQLKENGLKVACANVGCGYHRPHAADEYVVVSEVENTFSLFKCIISTLVDAYPHTYQRPSYYKNYKNEGNQWTPKNYQRFWDEMDYDTDNYWRKRDRERIKYGSGISSTLSPIHYCDGCCEQATNDELTYCSDYNAFLCNRCAKVLS